MTAAQRERAQRIHREATIVDLHDHMGRPQDFDDMLRGGVDVKVYKPINDGKYYDDHNRRIFPAGDFNWTKHYQQIITGLEHLERKSGSRALIVRRFADIEKARRENKAAVILGNEGCLPLGTELGAFVDLYDRGLREIALHWPAGRQIRHVLKEDGTLTPLAVRIIEQSRELGVAVDTCHLSNTPAFFQVLEVSKVPTIHSHGAGRYPRSRTVAEGDLDDKQIRAIADKGGIIGVHFCTYIQNINGHYWQPTIEDLMDHVQYLVKIGGIDCVGIGCDYFPYNRRPVNRAFQDSAKESIEDRDWSRTFIAGLENISGMPAFTEGLVSRGFDEKSIRKILGENALRVFQAIWKN